MLDAVSFFEHPPGNIANQAAGGNKQEIHLAEFSM